MATPHRYAMEEALGVTPPSWRVAWRRKGVPVSYQRHVPGDGTAQRVATVRQEGLAGSWYMEGASDIFKAPWVPKRWETAHAGMAEIDDHIEGLPS